MKIRNLTNKVVIELKKVGIPTPDLDVRVLLSASLDKDSVFILTHPDNLLTNGEYSKFRSFIRRRKKLEPVAYILGHKEFYGYDFFVNKNVLIPRPETEFLIEKTLEIINESFKNNKSISILDMGTGSGCIVVSLAKELEKVDLLARYKLYGVDNSKKALYVARKNAKKSGVNKSIKFYHSDLFSNKRLPKSFDIIITNLPYVPIESKSNQKQSIDFEPQKAIFAKNNGSDIIHIFLENIKTNKLPKWLLLELDSRNIEEIKNVAQNLALNTKIQEKKDLSAKKRYLVIKN